MSACEEDERRGPVREWRASDHAQPATPDPARVAADAPVAPTAIAPPDEPSPEMVARAAAALFESRCASCHGVTGRGDGPEAPSASMPDLSNGAFQDGRTDADFARAIRMGQGLMPQYGGTLNERGITALVGHVRTLRAAQ